MDLLDGSTLLLQINPRGEWHIFKLKNKTTKWLGYAGDNKEKAKEEFDNQYEKLKK